ncbi:MAG: hypothetical protein DMD86_09460 [Candidatus Rokuibacteriota bacterium]|nr:MAG: hypothetical protein DMD86_09460 [Candidatus Rokubacteria bacterium]
MARKTPKRGQSGAQRQRNGAPPVVEDANLPRMGEGEGEPMRIGRGMSLMQEEPKRDEGTRNRMAPFRHVKSPAETRMPKGGYSGQEPPRPPRRTKPAGRASKPAKEGYVRLRVLVQNGELSVAGAKFVEGPLAPMEALHPGLAYEVTFGSRRVAAGAIPDAGVWRSFPDPLGRPELQGHHITEVPRYEIAVRVPARELPMSALPKARITLYRWRGTGPAAPVAGRSLKAQLKGRVDTIATLKGIRLSRLSKEAQAELRGALE